MVLKLANDQFSGGRGMAYPKSTFQRGTEQEDYKIALYEMVFKMFMRSKNLITAKTVPQDRDQKFWTNLESDRWYGQLQPR